MRQNRKLEEFCWYDIDAKVNNGEKLYGVRENVKQFEQVVNEAHFLFDFEIRGLKFNDAKVRFFIKPDDGLKLPEIMQWIKQTFAVRFNRDHGREGHVWGSQGRTRNVERVCWIPAARRAPEPGFTKFRFYGGRIAHGDPSAKLPPVRVQEIRPRPHAKR
jgi:hypothetical protein